MPDVILTDLDSKFRKDVWLVKPGFGYEYGFYKSRSLVMFAGKSSHSQFLKAIQVLMPEDTWKQVSEKDQTKQIECKSLNCKLKA